MHRRLLPLLSFAGLSCFSLHTFASTPTPLPNPTLQSTQDVQAETNFLVGSLMKKGSGTFQTIDKKLPMSYYSNNLSYWGDYACSFSGADCTVHDVVSYPPYAIAPDDPNSVGGQLQEERVFATQGANIYDASTWQIAVALAAVNHASSKLTVHDAKKMIIHQDERLDKIAGRAPTDFAYGYDATATHIQNLQYAYAFRMYGPSFLVNDPFKGTGYQSYITDGPKVPTNQQYQVSWADWKPISGENGWAFLLGGVQAADILAKGQPVSVNNLALNNAINFLSALQRMQTDMGAFYYATDGSSGNTGKPVPKGEISTENNASILGGLHVLQQTIQHIPGWQVDPKLAAANNVIDIMIYGGKLPQGGTTKGLLSYFKHDAWNTENDTFYQGGTYVNGVFTKTTTPFALDVNTWGVAAIGPKTVDAWWGQGMAYKIWDASRREAGYFNSKGALWGVGYTDQSAANAIKVLSGEWTAGAINMVHMLIQYYEANPGITTAQLASLKQDEKTMQAGLMKLRTDNYQASDFANEGGVDTKFLTTLPTDEKAVFYANRRYYIPFGWYANPIPSTASTAWTIMMSYWYNPFNYEGSMDSPDFATVPSYDQNNDQLYYAPGSITVLNELMDLNTNEFKLPISVSYNTTAQPNNWQPLTTISNGSWADITIPTDADTVGIAYEVNGQYYSACTISKDQFAKLQKGNPLHTAIIGAWVANPNNPSDGGGACQLILGS